MPKKGTKSREWNKENMTAAIKAVQNKSMGLRAAAKRHGVPVGTLHRYMKAENPSSKLLVKMDRKPTLGDEIELQLVKYCLQMESIYFGLTRSDIRSMAYQLAVKNKLVNSFSQEKSVTGRYWLKGFLQRHSELSFRRPTGTSVARAKGFNKESVDGFFKILGNVLVEQKFLPHRIFNVDETGFSVVPSGETDFTAAGEQSNTELNVQPESSSPMDQSNERIVFSSAQPSLTTDTSTSSVVVTPWEIFPPPILTKSKNPRGRKATKARLLTDPSFKDELIEVQQRKDAAQLKKEAAALKRAARTVKNTKAGTATEKPAGKTRGRKKKVPDTVHALDVPTSEEPDVVVNRGRKRIMPLPTKRKQVVEAKQPRLKKTPKAVKQQKRLEQIVSSDSSSDEEFVQSDGSSQYNELDTPLTVISDIRTYHLSDKSISPLPTPAPPSTPRKTKVSTHNAMTVSVTHAQVSIATATSSVTNPAVVAMAMIRPTSPGNSSSSDTENVAHSSSTALRRLYFKSARSSRAKGPTVPKVVVMGSSTTSNSEATINTSTESASTLVTNVTATDTSETCDSLDLGDTSGQSEPLLSSFDEPATAISINLRQTGNLTEDEDHNLITPGADTPLLINYEGNDLKNRKAPQAPRTAPITSTTHFPFDTPTSPKSVRSFEKNQSLFTFSKDSCPYQPTANNATTAATTMNQRVGVKVLRNGCTKDEEKENEKRWEQSKFLPRKFSDALFHETDIDDCKMEKKDISLKSRNRFLNSIKNLSNKEKYGSNSKINSAPVVGLAKRDSVSDTTMFPFDREAIDYERIQRECFAVEEDPNGFPYGFDTDSSVIDTDSPAYEKPYFDSPSKSYQKIKMDKYTGYPSNSDIFHQYKMIAQQESMLSHDKDMKKSNKFDKRKSDAFIPKPNNESVIKSVSKFDQIASKFEQIPPKPLDAFHHTVQPELHYTSTASSAQQATSFTDTTVPNLRIDYFAESKQNDTLDDGQKLTHNSPGAINVTPNPMDAPVCTQPRATIVVQQASLSLDNTVETFLLKNEGDFVSVEQGKDSTRKQKREENMRQLLDVTNTLTTEEIRDFEMRYGSPHHCRSQSVKTPGSRASGRPNQLCLPQQRSRVASMPNTGVEEEYYRLRHFSITGKGVVNRGDSLKSKRSRSNNSVASSNSSTEHLTATNILNSARTSATCSLASSRESSTSNPGNGPYKVLMLGGAAVGKSSLVSQFMTSEYLHAYDTSIDDDSGEKSVSVLLSGEESELVFIDHSSADMSPENCLSSYNPHGYCVIYSSADRSSFVIAERIIQSLWTSENIAQRAVILVGNKADLARSRVITSEEGKAMATAYDCKFIETSVGINHNVDELLVGLLSQIRLKLENPEKSRDLFRKRSYRKSKRRACSPLGTACLSGNGGTNASTPVSATANNLAGNEFNTPPSSAQSSPRKYRGSRTSTSLKVKGLLGRVWARDSKSKSCENLHVL